MTIKEIESDIEKMSEMLMFCKQLIFDSYGMLMTNTNEKFTTISRDKFLKRVQQSFWKLAIIELTKLYSNDNYSILILLKSMRNQHLKSSWKNKITPEELKKEQAILKTKDIKIRIEKLNELRNQHYAHTDKNSDNNIYDIKLHYNDCIYLIGKAENTIYQLANKFNCKIWLKDYKGEEMNEFIDKHIEFKNLSTVRLVTQTKTQVRT